MLILTTLLLVVVMGGVGLAIDAGHLQWSRSKLQTAADMAALSAGLEITRGASDLDVERAARAAALRNGYDRIEVQRTKPSTVDVVVIQPVPTFFMRLFRVNTVELSAKAVVTGEGSQLRLTQ